jgi:hypothetical protein
VNTELAATSFAESCAISESARFNRASISFGERLFNATSWSSISASRDFSVAL